MQLVIKNGKVFSYHKDDQDIFDLYPGMIIRNVDQTTFDSLNFTETVQVPGDDPNELVDVERPIMPDDPVLTMLKVDIQSSLKAIVKTEARRRILAIVPEWKQNNLNARMNDLNDKRIGGEELTQDEMDEIAAMKALWAQVQAIRTASDTLESSIDSMSIDDLKVLNVRDDTHWP